MSDKKQQGKPSTATQTVNGRIIKNSADKSGPRRPARKPAPSTKK